MENPSQTQKRSTNYNVSGNPRDYNKTKKKRVNKCALCHKTLENESYSDHYCATNIEISGTSYLKKLLRKESEPRENNPEVQHAWADPHPDPSRENTYLLKIKAPLDIIPRFIQDLQKHLVVREQVAYNSRPVSNRFNSRPSSPFDRPSSRGSTRSRSPRSPQQPSKLLCSFFNSPDGCTNSNCQRIHIEDTEERKRLLDLKETINNSKILNEPIKSLFTILEDAIEKNQDIFEAIQENFNEYIRQPKKQQIFNEYIRQPKEESNFQENVEYIQRAFEFGQELIELREELKAISRRCYTNSNVFLQQELHRLIEYTKMRVAEMRKLEITEEKIYQKSKSIYDTQFFSQCILVI